MKKFAQILWALALLVGLSACKEDAESAATSTITLGQDLVTLASDGTPQSIGYLIENPVEGAALTATYEADWLTVNTQKARTVEFSATTNQGSEVRTTQVTLGYPGAKEVVLTVKQLTFETPLSIEITKVGPTDVTFSVTTEDPDLTWMPMCVRKAYFDSVESWDDLYQEDIEYYRYTAGNQNMSLTDFLSAYLATGSVEDIYFEDLDTATEYVIYTYGLTNDGRRTTDVVWQNFTTDPPYEGDITFSFEVFEENYILTFTVKPSHTGVPYYHGIVDEPTLKHWMETYNTQDIREAIQKGDIEANIQHYIDLEFMDDAADYYDMFVERGVMEDGFEKAAANTKYILYAAKWNEECQLVGEVSTYEYTTADIALSDNQITLTVSDITQSSATATVTTTNKDPFVVIPVKTSEITDKSDGEIFSYLVSSYEYLLSEYTFNGDFNGFSSKTYQRMRPNTDYTFLAFGYEGKTQTTVFQKQYFTTLASGDPADCTFTFFVEPDTDNAWVEVTPSDKGHFYHWMVYPGYYTEQNAKDYILLSIEQMEGNIAAFSSWNLSQGDDRYTATGLYPETEYKVGAIVMDYDTGEFLGDMVFSDIFKTGEKVYADLKITLTYGPYYDLNALVASGLTQYQKYLEWGDALMPVSIAVSGNPLEFYYDIYKGDYSDTEMYPDAMFYTDLYNGAWFKSAALNIPYDTPMTLMAIAYDWNDNPTVIQRAVITATFEGASPIEGFNTSLTPISKRDSKPVPLAAKPATIERKIEGDKCLYTPEVMVRKAMAEEQIKANREKSLEAKLAARETILAAQNSFNGRKIAR